MSGYAELAKKVKQANRRLTNAKKFYGKDGHSSLTFAQKSIDYAYGDKEHARYTLNENMTKTQLKRIEKGVDAVLNSPYFTAKGRKELEKKVQEDAEKYKKFFDFFQGWLTKNNS